MNEVNSVGTLSAKALACALALVFLALGVIGLVLPIIPGLLFLALALFVLVKSFPSLETLLRKHRAIDRHLDEAHRIHSLSFGDKMRVAGLLCMKLLLAGAAVIASGAAKLNEAGKATRRR